MLRNKTKKQQALQAKTGSFLFRDRLKSVLEIKIGDVNPAALKQPSDHSNQPPAECKELAQHRLIASRAWTNKSNHLLCPAITKIKQPPCFNTMSSGQNQEPGGTERAPASRPTDPNDNCSVNPQGLVLSACVTEPQLILPTKQGNLELHHVTFRDRFFFSCCRPLHNFTKNFTQAIKT